MKMTDDIKTLVDLQADCRCVDFGNWLIKAVIVHPGLTMEEYLRRWKDE